MSINSINATKTRGHWTKEEDEKLREIVSEYRKKFNISLENPVILPEQLPFFEILRGSDLKRSSKQAADRYYNHLHPACISKISPETEGIVLDACKAIGPGKWKEIASYVSSTIFSEVLYYPAPVIRRLYIRSNKNDLDIQPYLKAILELDDSSLISKRSFSESGLSCDYKSTKPSKKLHQKKSPKQAS